MEPTSAVASIVSLLQGISASIGYIRDVKHASRDHLRLFHEMSSLSIILENMQHDRLEAQPKASWLQGFQTLAYPGGVFSQIDDIVTDIELRLSPDSEIKRLGQKLKWPFNKPEVERKLADIERLKSQINIVLHQDHLQLSKEILKTAENTQIVVDSIYNAVDSIHNTEDFDKIVAWLSPIKFPEKQQEIHGKAMTASGQWLLNSPKFEAWISGQTKTLYCVGEPGVGKTVLSSIVIDLLQNAPTTAEIPVLFVYLDHKDSLEQTLGNLVGSLIRQLLLLKAPQIPETIKKLWEECNRGETKPNIEQLLESIESQLEKFEKSYIIVDALDECLNETTRHKLLRLLYDLQKRNVFLLVTSRPLPNIFILHVDTAYCNGCGASDQSYFYHCGICHNGDYDLCEDCVNNGTTCLDGDHTLLKFYTCQQIDVKAAAKDLHLYIEAELRSEPESESRLEIICKKNTKIKEKIISKVMKGADGVFLYAKLFMDVLKTKRSPKTVTMALENPPETLDELYNDTFERIEKQGEDDFMYAKKIFLWLTWSKRALSKEELIHALAVSQNDDDLDTGELLDESYLFSVTGGLISADYRGHLRIVHKTLDGFLRKNKGRWFSDAEDEITMITLTYLNFESFAAPCQGNNEDELLEQRLTDYPFLIYASEHWGEHARERYKTCPDIQIAVLKIVRDPLRLASAIQAAWYSGSGWNVREGINSLHVCAWFGLEDLISDLLGEGVQVDSKDPVYGQTSLMYACKRGHAGTVEILLAHGAQVNIRSARGSTALLEAVQERQTDVVEELMKVKTLEVNAKHPHRYSMNALQLAISFKSIDITKLLLTRPDIRVNETNSHGMTALMGAALTGEPALIKTLLQHPDTDVDFVDSFGHQTALVFAAERGFVENVRALLERNADPNIKDFFGGVPILRAIDSGHIETVKTMVELGVNIKVLDESGRSLLHGASINRQFEIAGTLLDAGLNINAQGNSGETCLHDAARCGNSKVAMLLLQRGIDSSIKDKEGRVALEVAIQNGKDEVANLIRDKTQDKVSYKVPMWGMTIRGDSEGVERYIQDGGDLDGRDPDTGDSALHKAAWNGYPEILNLLLNAKMDLDGTNDYGRTALHNSAIEGKMECSRLLINNKASLDLKDTWGKSALVYAHNLNRREIVVLLIEANAIIDKDLCPIQRHFFDAVLLGNIEAVKRLINEGADLQALEDQSGRTALQLAKHKEHAEITQILREHKSFHVQTYTTSEQSEDKVPTLSQPRNQAS